MKMALLQLKSEALEDNDIQKSSYNQLSKKDIHAGPFSTATKNIKTGGIGTFKLQYHNTGLNTQGASEDKVANLKCKVTGNKRSHRNYLGKKGSLRVYVKAVSIKAKYFACNLCDFWCATKHTMNRHVKNNCSNKCTEHKNSTSTKTSLKKSKSAVFPNKAYITCEHCNHKATRKFDLKRHLRDVHTKINEYQCGQCDFFVSQRSNLQRHIMEIHEKIKAFKCDQCEFRTSRKSNLYGHLLDVHFSKLGKVFNCNNCGYSNNYRAKLKLHMERKHWKIKDFKCDECDYSTCDKYSLKLHTVVHRRLKTFRCGRCNYATKTNKLLQRHVRCIHEKQNVMSDSCDFSTLYRGNNHRHTKNLHTKIKDNRLKSHCKASSSNKTRSFLSDRSSMVCSGPQSKYEFSEKTDVNLLTYNENSFERYNKRIKNFSTTNLKIDSKDIDKGLCKQPMKPIETHISKNQKSEVIPSDKQKSVGFETVKDNLIVIHLGLKK